ncbi:hypothetical protein [Bacillus benzoevorans]|uniref:Uncharacterized protein n=1 Tax=Bacillus benzoevorans TaxID=1456 RepID=A0A7X0HXY2_9BACI|nr:hypothetical protein [Bacillus benzoevorans]MBB6447651.1 hypothetical protein [Bacillus benzoevorans]
MKKGFISALFVSLMIAAPAIVQAEENEKPLLPVEWTNVLSETVQELESLAAESDTDTEVQVAGLAPEVSITDQEKSSGLLSIGLGLPVVGEVKVDLLAGGKVESVSDNTTSSQNSLLGVEIKNSELLGDVNLEVLKTNQQGEDNASSGLVSLDVDSALLGQTHVGVLEGNKSGASDKANISTSLLVVESKDSMLGNKRVGVGEYSKKSGLQRVKLANFSDDPISNVISGTNNHFAEQVNPASPSGQGINSSIEKNGSDQSAVGSKDSKELSLSENVLAIANLADAGNSTVLNQQKENELDKYKEIINQVNESDSNTIKLVSSAGSVAQSSVSTGGSTGNAGTANSSGVTGLAGYLAVDYLKEIETCSQVINRSDEFSDQWQTSPPGDPPKAAFFLIA